MDDLVVQLVLVDRRQMPSGAGKHGIELLRAHEAWETGYASRALSAKVASGDIEIINAAGRGPTGSTGGTTSRRA